MRNSKFRSFFVAAVGLAACVAALAQTTASFNLPAQPLADSLRAVAGQTNSNILFDRNLVAGMLAKALKAELSTGEALKELLEGTGLTYRKTDEKTVMIVPIGADLKPTAEVAQSGAFRLAQGDKPIEQAPSAEGGGNLPVLEEVIVTGTHIRGSTAPVGSPLKVYSREDIDRSGAATIDQFARQRMLENFSTVDAVANVNSSASRFGPDGSNDNDYGASSFNLRGVGPTATLTLLNGSRLAPGGQNGGFTDTSLIPVSAIERIEVLTDGASALYGADAVAGVVNIITRKDFAGAETRLRVGDTTAGGGAQYGASQALGTSWDGGNVMLDYQYTKQDALDAAERSYLPDQGGPLLLVGENEGHSAFLSGNQSLGSRTRLFGHALYSERDGGLRDRRPQTGIDRETVVSYGASQPSVSLGLEQGLSGDWIGTLTGNYSRLSQDSHQLAANDFGIFSTSTILDKVAVSKVFGADLLVNGTLARLRSSALKIALGASHRAEEFQNSTTGEVFFNGASISTFAIPLPHLDRNVDSVFAELRLPVLLDANSSQRLELAAAGRFDDYNDNSGSKTTYTAGASWSPTPGLQFRGTYGTSFRAPLLANLGTEVAVAAGSFFPDDPAFAPSGFSDVITIGGGNPALRPEESTSFTAGVEFKPSFVPHLTVGVSYYDIDFTDRIGTPNLQPAFLLDAAAAPFITRNPPLADVQALFAAPGFENPFGLQPQDIDVIYTGIQITNLSSTRQSGLDLDAAYDLTTAYGDLTFTLSAVHLLKNKIRTLPGQPMFDYRNTFAQPPEWRGRGGVSWTRNAFSSTLTFNYTNRYRNGLARSAGDPEGSDERIDAWTTADFSVSYDTGESDSAGLLHNLDFILSVTNLTNVRPPVVLIPAAQLAPGATYLPFDSANASPLGRSISLQISKGW